jgi:hypothetical protein
MSRIKHSALVALIIVVFLSGAHATKMHDNFERLEGPPYVPALVEYAASVGVAQEAITASIIDGTFVPHPQDIMLVKIELDPRSCDEIAEVWRRRELSGFDCNREKRRLGSPGDRVWNEMFGPPSEEFQFHMAQRFPRHRDSSPNSWQRGHVRYEEVKDLSAVKSSMNQVGSWSIASLVETRSMNDQYQPKDFGGVYQKNREAFVLRRGDGVVDPKPEQAQQVVTLDAPPEDRRGPSRFTPTAKDIQTAIQAKVDAAFQRLDAMGDQCKTYRRDNNPMAAMMCLLSGGGSMNSQTGSIQITSVSLDHCVQMEDPSVSAYCRYWADMSMSGSGMMSQVATLVNAASAFQQWTWASFRRDRQTWQLVESWDRCWVDNDALRCHRRR